jgi:hypothetical protein
VRDQFQTLELRASTLASVSPPRQIIFRASAVSLNPLFGSTTSAPCSRSALKKRPITFVRCLAVRPPSRCRNLRRDSTAKRYPGALFCRRCFCGMKPRMRKCARERVASLCCVGRRSLRRSCSLGRRLRDLGAFRSHLAPHSECLADRAHLR